MNKIAFGVRGLSGGGGRDQRFSPPRLQPPTSVRAVKKRWGANFQRNRGPGWHVWVCKKVLEGRICLEGGGISPGVLPPEESGEKMGASPPESYDPMSTGNPGYFFSPRILHTTR